MFLPEVGGPVPYSYNSGQEQEDAPEYNTFSTSQNHQRGRGSSFAGGSLLKPGERFNAKVPPSFNGGSWFQYEEDVRDWITMTDLTEELSLIHI